MFMKLCIKRTFDILISGTALIILFPIFVTISLLVYIKLGSPIFFIHKRPGKKGRPFNMIKFRSMLDKKDKDGRQLHDSQRLTTFGKILRSTSLDELPELINVLKGDMSLVGPRPLLEEYLVIYNDKQKKRHDVLPGITGWAQINGRNTISWNEKFNLDVWYVDNWSLWLDFKIFFLTIYKVLKREGISHAKHATSEKFNGVN